MYVEVLSDHGRQQFQQTAQRLQQANSDVVASQGLYSYSAQNLQAARRDKPFLKRMLGVSTAAERHAEAQVGAAWQQLQGAGLNRMQVSRRAHQQAAGLYGEDALTWALSVLSDDWLMLRGYHNRRGETDHVLVGPSGVWAVEVKRYQVRLHADGDTWWFERISARGNIFEAEWAVDGGGRSWARQVNDVAGDLQWWLAKNGFDIPVHTAVMLMHERAVLGNCQNVTVDLLSTNPDYLVGAVCNLPPSLGEYDCERVARLIRRDHSYHEKKRRNR